MMMPHMCAHVDVYNSHDFSSLLKQPILRGHYACYTLEGIYYASAPRPVP